MADIPQAVLDRLERLEAQNKKLLEKADQQTIRSVHEEKEQYLRDIRRKSLFQGLGDPPKHHHEEGLYPFALYRRTTRRDAKGALITDVRGDIAVERIAAESDAHKAQLLADGWFVNPLGIDPDAPESDQPSEPTANGKKRGRPRKTAVTATEGE